MTTVSGWDVLLFTVEVTETGAQIRVGGFIVLLLVWLVHRVLRWFDDGPGRNDNRSV